MPDWIAAWGMPSYSASFGSWAIVRPPRSLIRRSPRVPSLPVPVNTTATERPSWVCERVRKKWSIGARSRRSRSSADNLRWVSTLDTLAFGGMT